ncbi:MAG: putative toxin-antitoxin system toxin component, PIN family [Anaerolineales bacterium]|nr:putative toxin-antitoxin system toxin component, PIN family [Anaerolineales bacterium]
MRVVLDTNILFEGLTQRGGACGLIIDAWQARLFSVCLSNALAYEYQDVLSRKLSEHRWQEIKPVLNSLLEGQSEFVKIYLSWRPISPDPGDDHVIDCAMNARALIVTSNIRDFEQARQVLGVEVMTPLGQEHKLC